MKKIGLIGFAYNTPSLNLQQQRAGEKPDFFEWSFGDESQETTVYCEQTMFEEKRSVGKRIGLLIEPQELRPWHYQKAIAYRNDFHMVLTHNRALLSMGAPFGFYPLGGSYLKEWDVFPKSKNISIIPGYKDFMVGHKLRHFVVDLYGGTGLLDVFPYNTLPVKTPALKPYRFSVVIENSLEDFWFTEKLIDALSQGTIPIYWGCPSISRYFDERGIIQFNHIADLEKILRLMANNGEKYYSERINSVRTNLELARQYASMENWLSGAYPNIFR